MESLFLRQEKSALLSQCAFFNEIRPCGREKSRCCGMKSLGDEIRLGREGDGFPFICAADFIRTA
jgi:hypothetical protein